MLAYIFFVMGLVLLLFFSSSPTIANNSQNIQNTTDVSTTLISAGLIKSLSPFFAFSLSAAVAVALFPAKTPRQMFGLLACCASSFWYVGPFVIEYFHLQNYSMEAKDGIRFFCAVPSWMIWQIIAVILTKYRNSKTPIKDIMTDIKRIKSK